MKKLLLAFSLTLISVFAFSQTKEKEIIAITVGEGVLTFHGDVGSNSLVGAYSFIRRGFSFSAEKHFNKNFALSLNVLKGKIARDEKASDNLPKLNFESPITQFGLSGTFLMTGKREQFVIPFLSVGLAFLAFDPHGDLKDKYGNSYYYWKDGSIRDMPETPNTFYAKTIDRDYKYETKLKDSVNYSRSTIALPLSAGVKLKLTPNFDVNLGLTYHLSFSDYIDNLKSGSNDAFLFSSVSLTYHFIALPKKEREEVSQLFTDLDKMDSDKDGTPDAEDFCPGTPKGIKVDGKGCPIDSDADGIPDYLDKEPNSLSNSFIDANGVAMDDSTIARNYRIWSDSTNQHALSESFNKKPSAAFMKEIEEMQKEMRKNLALNPDRIGAKSQIPNPKSLIPFDLRIADWNKDNFISSDEIMKTIDAFFDGSITINAEQINRLVDFFFEQ